MALPIGSTAACSGQTRHPWSAFTRHCRVLLLTIAFITFVAVAAPVVLAQASPDDGVAEFSLDIGYANVSLSDSSVIDGEGGIHFEPALTFSLIRQLPQLRV